MLDDKDKAGALTRLRVLSRMSQRTAARRIGVARPTLRSWERRESWPTDSQLVGALRVYGADLDGLLVPRIPISDPDTPGTLTVGSCRIDTAAIRFASADPGTANRTIIAEYLAAVRQQRNVETDGAVELRSVDLSRLAVELDLTDGHLSELLAAELNLTPAGSKLATRALLVAALMSLAALTGLGGGWLRAPGPNGASSALTVGPVAGQTFSPQGTGTQAAFSPSLETSAGHLFAADPSIPSQEPQPTAPRLSFTIEAQTVHQRSGLGRDMFTVAPDAVQSGAVDPDAVQSDAVQSDAVHPLSELASFSVAPQRSDRQLPSGS